MITTILATILFIFHFKILCANLICEFTSLPIGRLLNAILTVVWILLMNVGFAIPFTHMWYMPFVVAGIEFAIIYLLNQIESAKLDSLKEFLFQIAILGLAIYINNWIALFGGQYGH